MNETYSTVNITITSASLVTIEMITLWLGHDSRFWSTALKDNRAVRRYGKRGNYKYAAREVLEWYKVKFVDDGDEEESDT